MAEDQTGETVLDLARLVGQSPLLWTAPSPLSPGFCSAELTVSTRHGSANTISQTVRLDSLPPLQFTGPTGGPVHDPPASFNVQFHLKDQGATEGLWSFGDGTVELFTDPVQGRNPLHTYAALGSYPVFVIIRNCLSVFGRSAHRASSLSPGPRWRRSSEMGS